MDGARILSEFNRELDKLLDSDVPVSPVAVVGLARSHLADHDMTKFSRAQFASIL